MNFTNSEALEWEHVLALVRRYLATSAGDAELAKVAPSIDRADIESALAEAGEGMAYLRAAAPPRLPERARRSGSI